MRPSSARSLSDHPHEILGSRGLEQPGQIPGEFGLLFLRSPAPAAPAVLGASVQGRSGQRRDHLIGSTCVGGNAEQSQRLQEPTGRFLPRGRERGPRRDRQRCLRLVDQVGGGGLVGKDRAVVDQGDLGRIEEGKGQQIGQDRTQLGRPFVDGHLATAACSQGARNPGRRLHRHHLLADHQVERLAVTAFDSFDCRVDCSSRLHSSPGSRPFSSSSWQLMQ